MADSKVAKPATGGTRFRTMADAKRALQRFRNNGHLLDPDNEDHVTAYLVTSQPMGRVTPRKIRLYLKASEQHMEHGSQSYMKYWCVPKANFPDGLPSDVAGFAQSPADLTEA